MFKAIKRFFHNLFWKEKRVVKEDPKRSNFNAIEEEQQASVASYKTPTKPSPAMTVRAVGESERRGLLTDVRNVANPYSAAAATIPRGERPVLRDEEYQERKRQLSESIGLERKPHTLAVPGKNDAIISPVVEEDEGAGDENYALEAGHVMGPLSQSLYRQLCTMKHHQDFQTPEARENLFGLLNALKNGDWVPETGKIPGDEKFASGALAIEDLVSMGLRRDTLHLIEGTTPASKSMITPPPFKKESIDEVEKMLHDMGVVPFLTPDKLMEGDRTEIDLQVKKLDGEIDCRVTKVKVVKARLKPLSKNEASRMSPRRRKKESQKVIEVSRGKHRG